MIQKTINMYHAVCDGCGKKLKGSNGNTVFTYTPLLLEQTAIKQGWLIENHELYCPDCVEYDEETDSYKPKKKKQ